MSDERGPAFYTVIFKGNIRSMSPNLFDVVEPFGEVVAIGVGNAFEVQDALSKELRQLREADPS